MKRKTAFRRSQKGGTDLLKSKQREYRLLWGAHFSYDGPSKKRRHHRPGGGYPDRRQSGHFWRQTFPPRFSLPDIDRRKRERKVGRAEIVCRRSLRRQSLPGVTRRLLYPRSILFSRQILLKRILHLSYPPPPIPYLFFSPNPVVKIENVIPLLGKRGDTTFFSLKRRIKNLSCTFS